MGKRLLIVDTSSGAQCFILDLFLTTSCVFDSSVLLWLILLSPRLPVPRAFWGYTGLAHCHRWHSLWQCQTQSKTQKELECCIFLDPWEKSQGPSGLWTDLSEYSLASPRSFAYHLGPGSDILEYLRPNEIHFAKEPCFPITLPWPRRFCPEYLPFPYQLSTDSAHLVWIWTKVLLPICTLVSSQRGQSSLFSLIQTQVIPDIYCHVPPSKSKMKQQKSFYMNLADGYALFF